LNSTSGVSAMPWLLFPGLACMGTGGLTLLATNMQV